MVLVVPVHGDHAQAVRPVFLAPVDLVAEQMDFRMQPGSVLKIVEIFRFAAVVDQDDVGKAVFQQAVNDGGELLVRIQGGQNNRYIR